MAINPVIRGIMNRGRIVYDEEGARMTTGNGRAIIICLIIAGLCLGASSFLYADRTEILSGKEYALLARGGILYDNWPAELGIKLDRTHPAYPGKGRQKGETTWRCKECHGWDYRGKDGQYGKGSHYTGITGIRDFVYKDPKSIVKILMDKTHAFEGLIPEEGLEALSLFVTYGQVAVDIYIDPETGKSIGYTAGGGRIFLNTCVKCHGEDGKGMNLGDEKNPQYIGTVANENPWEVLHKIRWGHPGTQMVSLLFLGLNDQLDVLSFCQTLPRE
jgi:thiosulfate dehydrogenase